MSLPTQEAWFDPWEVFLREKGVIFNTCSQLELVHTDGTHITSCVVRSSGGVAHTVKADDYLFCINPFNLEEILHRSHIPSLYRLQAKANHTSDYEMIAFAIPIQRKIKWTRPNQAYILEDGALNITFYAQDQIWQEGVNLGEGVKSLWSGTCILTRRSTDLYPDKMGRDLSLDELRREITHEFLSSEDLQSHITMAGGHPLVALDLEDLIIWYEWRGSPHGRLTPKYKKYTNNVYNQFSRMPQTTHLSNGFISGAHTKTSIDIWSMEGGVESGILTSNHIMSKYGLPSIPLYTHKRTKTPIHIVDNFLYNLKLPHLFDIILITVALIGIVCLVLLVIRLSRRR